VIERESISGPPFLFNKRTGILIEAKNREEAACLLGGHVHNYRGGKKIFFKRSELEKNPAWKKIKYTSTDMPDFMAFSETIIAFALEIAPSLNLNVAFFGDQESHIDDYLEWDYTSRLSDPNGGFTKIPMHYWFHLEEIGILYRQRI
jgi:hypothetical protein